MEEWGVGAESCLTDGILSCIHQSITVTHFTFRGSRGLHHITNLVSFFFAWSLAALAGGFHCKENSIDILFVVLIYSGTEQRWLVCWMFFEPCLSVFFCRQWRYIYVSISFLFCLKPLFCINICQCRRMFYWIFIYLHVFYVILPGLFIFKKYMFGTYIWRGDNICFPLKVHILHLFALSPI